MTSNQISDLEGKAKVVPVEDRPMTQKEKLLHWAELVRATPGHLALFSNLERWTPEMLEQEYLCNTAFSVAANDAKFRAAGLLSNAAASVMKFFNISQEDLHEFSCDCGGEITNVSMAQRIERLANRGAAPTQAGFFSKLVG